MMRLRTSLGVSGQEYEKKYLMPFDPIEEALVQCRERGYALRGEGGRWRLTPEGMLLSNSILSDLLLIQDKSEPLAKRR
jgi:coproporphyrinogen III oxidase-like Fe-S oxidoreductase